MRWKSLQFFFFGFLFFFSAALLHAAPVYALTLTDVDQNKLSTADGHVTVIVVTNSTDVDKAQMVGARVPDRCLGDPTYRLITLLTFERPHSSLARLLVKALARRRLDAAAKRLQPRYTAKRLARDPRSDTLAVLDFDGTIASQFGLASPTAFQVLVLGRNGELLQRWSDVPTAAELDAVIK